jgi:hypothetical protein
VKEKSGHRAVKVYSALAATYTAPKYSAAVGDALSSFSILVVIFLFFLQGWRMTYGKLARTISIEVVKPEATN